MGTVRHFGGDRENKGKRTIAQEIMRIEADKKGKMSAEQRYKLIFKRRLEESKQKDMAQRIQNGKKGELIGGRKMSDRAEKALKEIAAKKAAKEAKKLRKMVLVEPAFFSNGQLKKTGKIYDIAGNTIGKVNTKNGKMSTSFGGVFGKYKPKSYYTKLLIQEAINKHSPYIQQQQRLLQQRQAAGNAYGVHQDTNVINVHGMNSAQMAMLGGNYHAMGAENFAHANIHGNSHDEHDMPADKVMRGNNATGTAWGAMADNVMGTFSNNVHGTTGDNVWGTATADVWGSVGAGDMWGQKGPRMWGTGGGENYLAKIGAGVFGSALKTLFRMVGFVPKSQRDAVRNSALIRQAYRNSSSGPRLGSGGGAGGSTAGRRR